MKRIPITQEIKDYANEYFRDLMKLEPNPQSRLQQLKDALSNKDYGLAYTDYVSQIESLLETFVTVSPFEYGEMTRYFCNMEDIINREVHIAFPANRERKDKLYNFIVEALQYDKVRSQVFPRYAQKMEIRSCVYCNAQYAVSAKREPTGTDYRSTYTLDHYMPKCKYPYLAVSFFNLYPCCPSCNQTKASKEPIWSLYCEPNENDNPYLFRLEDASLRNYLLDPALERLEIIFQDKGIAFSPDADSYDDYFHIRQLYANFKDVAEELVWRSQKYNESWYQSMNDLGFPGNLSFEEGRRMLLGNYVENEDILRRPLAKFMQDIGRQLQIIQ